MSIFKELLEGGGYCLPYLMHLQNPAKTVDIYIVNNNTDVVYNGHTYASSNFTYTPNTDSNSNFEVEIVDHDEIIDLIEDNYYFTVEAIGVLFDGEVQPITTNKHKYGTATWDGKSASITLEKDDRFNMTFPALIFNSYNNRGNT